MSLTAFFAIMLASLLDPLSVVGYLLSGILIKRYWFAAAAGVGWRVLLFAVTSSYSGSRMIGPALVGAFLFTSLTFLARGWLGKKSASV
jgi:hypothetical protein